MYTRCDPLYYFQIMLDESDTLSSNSFITGVPQITFVSNHRHQPHSAFRKKRRGEETGVVATFEGSCKDVRLEREREKINDNTRDTGRDVAKSNSRRRYVSVSGRQSYSGVIKRKRWIGWVGFKEK